METTTEMTTMTNTMTQTREIAIPADLLLAVFPPAIRDDVPPISMSELAIDAIRVAEARGELGRTQRLTAIEDEDIRTAACDCSNGVRHEGRESWVCTDCDGTGEVRYCHHCGEIVGDADECAACKVV